MTKHLLPLLFPLSQIRPFQTLPPRLRKHFSEQSVRYLYTLIIKHPLFRRSWQAAVRPAPGVDMRVSREGFPLCTDALLSSLSFTADDCVPVRLLPIL
jgi:hypothetical protein